MSSEDMREPLVYEVTIHPRPALTYWVRATSPDQAVDLAERRYWDEDASAVDCSRSPIDHEVGEARDGSYSRHDVIEASGEGGNS